MLCRGNLLAEHGLLKYVLSQKIRSLLHFAPVKKRPAQQVTGIHEST